MKKPLALLLSLVLTAGLLSACGKGDSPAASSSMPDEPSVSVIAPVEEPEPEPEPEPVLPYTNPLTGEGSAVDLAGARPVAIMLNNLKKALPQLGVSQADLIYELPAEGGITRMMAVFQSVEGVGDLGSVRSARDYYVSLARGHDAVFLHAGGSPQAYSAIKNMGVTALDCVNGPYEGTLFWRDKTRKKTMGLEHSVLTSGQTIQNLLPTYGIRLEHKDGFSYPVSFLMEGETASGDPAETVSVRFSDYKTGVFTYDAQAGLYRVSEYGSAYVDIKGDDKGRQSVRTTGTGSGQLFCDGRVQDITWSRSSDSSPMTYLDAAGNPLRLGVGPSYINIVGRSATVTVG